MNSFQIYSIINNVEKYVKGKDIDIFTLGNDYYYKRKMRDFYKVHYKRIYNEVENNYYKIEDLAMYCLYKHIKWGGKSVLVDIKQQNVLNFLKILTEKRLNEDLELLKSLKKEFNFKGWKEFIEPKEDKTNIVSILFEKERISPITFSKFFKKLLTFYKENHILLTEDLERLGRISTKITNINNLKTRR